MKESYTQVRPLLLFMLVLTGLVLCFMGLSMRDQNALSQGLKTSRYDGGSYVITFNGSSTLFVGLTFLIPAIGVFLYDMILLFLLKRKLRRFESEVTQKAK